VFSGRYVPIFLSNLLPPSTGYENEVVDVVYNLKPVRSEVMSKLVGTSSLKVFVFHGRKKQHKTEEGRDEKAVEIREERNGKGGVSRGS
jgi:hypothetical protein